MEELDEFGIPIRRPQSEVDEFGIPIKKKTSSSTLSGGVTPLPNGSTPSIKPNKLSDQLREYDSAYESTHNPEENWNLYQAQRTPKKKETLQGDKTFMQSVKLGGKVLASSLAKGALSLLEGGQYVADKSTAIPSMASSVNNPIMDAKISSLHKDAEMGLNPEFRGRNAVEKFANTLVETAPALATAQFGGFFLSGLGNAHSDVQKMKESGVEFKNGSDDLYVLMNGVANELAMKELPVAKYLSKAPKPLRDAVVSKMSLGALEKIANSGEKITAENLMKPLAEEARSVSDKIMQGGVNFLKSYAKTEGVLGGLTISNAIAKKLSDKLSGSDNFDPSSGDLVEGIKNTFGESLGFSLLGTAVQGLTDPGALIRKTPIHTEVLKSLRSDPSDANAEQIRTDLKNHGQEQGWSPEQIDNSVQALNTIHDAVKAIPKTFGEAKFNKAVELITGRKDLEARMAEIKASKASNDESIRDVPTKEESLVQAKLDQSNDKLKELATDHKFRYNFDEEKGTYTKQLGENGKAEEITKDRYELEQLEKEYKKPKAEESVVDETVVEPTEEVVPQEEITNEQETKTSQDNGLDQATGSDTGVAEEGSKEQVAEVIDKKADELKRKSSDKILSEQKKDMLNQLSEVEEAMTDEDNGIQKVKDLGYDVNEDGQVTFDVEGDGVFKIHVDGVSDAIKEVQKAFPEKNLPVKDYKPKVSGAKMKSNPTQVDLENAKENLATATKSGNTKLQEVFQKEVDRLGKMELPEKTAKESKVAPEKVEPEKAGDSLRKLADKIEQGKIAKLGGFKASTGFDAVWDGSLTVVAQSLRTGAKIADAIESGLKHIRQTDWYKELTDKEGFEGQYRAHMEGELAAQEQATVEDATIPSDTTSAETIYGTKNSVTESLREGMGLPAIEIPKDRSEDASLNAWKEGKRMPTEIIDDLLNPDKDIYDKSITPNDEPIMREYIKQLAEQGSDLNKAKVDLEEKIQNGSEDASIDLESVNQQLLNHYDQMERALNASKTAGNIWHKVGAERQLSIDEAGLVLNSIQRIKTLYGKDIPLKVKQQLDDLQLKYDNLEAKNAKIEEQLKRKQAQSTFKSRPKRSIFGKKRTTEEFTKERDSIIEDLKKDFKKSLTNTYATLPGIPQLNAISPHVVRLMRLYGEEAGAKIDDVIAKVHNAVKDVVEGITTEDISDIFIGKYSDKKPLSELNKKIADFRTELRTRNKISDLEKGILVATKKRGESSPAVKELQEKLADLKKKSLNEFAEASIEDLKKQQRAIQTQIDKGVVFKSPVSKRQWETNPDWIKNNKEKNKLRDQLKQMENEAYDSKKSKFMRGLDWGNRWGRRVIFFGANAVYTKLSSAAVLGSFLHRPVEQGLGMAFGKMFPSIAKNAPIEGNVNAKAEAKWYGEFLNPKKFIKNTYDIAKTGETELSRELSRFKYRNHLPIIDLFAADTHIMIKDPVKRATFEASLINQLKWYADNGIDGTHPLMLESARQAAYKRAEYEIFQNTAKNGNAVSRIFNELEKKGIEERNSGLGIGKITGNAKYTAAALYHFFVPINTVPLNIIKRQLLGFRLPYTVVEAFSKNKDVKDGILNMTGEEADVIMRQLKKGSISAAYWTLGFVVAGKMAGGLYTQYYQDKKRYGVIKSERINVLGVDIPKNVQHNAQLQALQEGATWGIVYNHYIKDKGKSQLEAISRATASEGGTLLKQVPSAKMGSDIYNASQTPGGGTKFMNDLKRRVGVGKATTIFKLMGYGTEE